MIFIILAIYNEEKSIPALIGSVRDALKRHEYKVIAVDDGSSDNSLNILNALKCDDIIIVQHKVNLSIGAVFATGFSIALQEAKNDDDVVVVMESDQTSDVNILNHLIAEIEIKGNDISIASRYIRGGGYLNFPFFRRVYSVCANNILRKFFPISGVTDYTIFYRSYRVGLLRKVVNFFGIYNFINFRAFVSNSEVLIKAACFTKKISELPLRYNYGNKKGKSKLNILANILEYVYFISSMRKVIVSVRKAGLNQQWNA